MDKSTAMELLRLYRPGTADDQDPQMAEALQMAKQNPELAQWLDVHGKFHLAVREQLQQIPVPADLKRKIFRADAARRGRRSDFRNALVPLAAAAMIAFLAMIAWSYLSRPAANEFAACRDRIVTRAQRGYAMAMTSADLDAIHNFIRQKQYPDYALTKALAKLPGEGCATLEWHDQKISMICLNAGKNHDLFLFVMDKSPLQNPPASADPQYRQILHLMTASWADGDKIYILAGPGGEADLKQFLN